MSFERCRSNNKKDVDCQKNCIRPKGPIIAKVSDVIVDVCSKEKDGKEIYPPSQGTIELIGDYLFCRKKACKREKDYLVTYNLPSVTTVHIPKEKKGWQCFSFKCNEIKTIRHSIFDSVLGVYMIVIDGSDNRYSIRVGKGGKLSLSKELDEFMKKLQDVSSKDS